jgi:hypothetical protein
MIYTFYAIRHKQTKELMPQSVWRGGYTHWNPGAKVTDSTYFKLGVPRLFTARNKATQSIVQWFAKPNYALRYISDEPWADRELDIEEDGRKKEDLEIVEVKFIVKEGENAS